MKTKSQVGDTRRRIVYLDRTFSTISIFRITGVLSKLDKLLLLFLLISQMDFYRHAEKSIMGKLGVFFFNYIDKVNISTELFVEFTSVR